MINQKFVDVLDPSRVLIPVSSEGNRFLCRVMWLESTANTPNKDKNAKKKAPLFGGKVSLPKHLFSLDNHGRNSYIGFVAMAA